MKLRLLSWNVRGANDNSKRRVIKAMIRSQRVDLLSSGDQDSDIVEGVGEKFGFW